jgi:hypothetical protein
LLSATLSLQLPSLAQNEVIQWTDAALASIRAVNTPPTAASRSLAILGVAVFDAVNGIQPRYEHYLVEPDAPSDSDKVAALTTAAHDVLVVLWPTRASNFDALRDTILGGIANGQPKTNGINWGTSVAQQVLAARANDGSTAVVSYPGSTEPGAWRPTVSFGGVVRPALHPHWGDVTPFGVANVEALQPPSSPDLTTRRYATEVNFTKAYGSLTNSARTADQTEIGQFWGYGPGTATPPGHWNQIAIVAAQDRQLGIEETARLSALVNIAMADAAIVCWKCKYIDGLWRPITAIQLADTDGNPLTEADPNWAPLLATPPFPEYTSGHSTFSGAAATVLSAFFRGNERFTVGSDDLPGVLRSYKNFWDAAHESGVSRLYGGIHFWSANENGLSCGAAIGREINRMLRALPGSNGNGHGNGHGNAGHKH